MLKRIDIFCAIFLMTISLHAPVDAELILDTDRELSMTAGLNSNPLVVSATTTASASVTGWQTSLRVVPDNSAIGTLQFVSVDRPSMDYVLDSIGNGVVGTLFTKTSSDDQYRTFDFRAPGGVTHKSYTHPTTVNLQSLVFTSSHNAVGTFGLFVIDEPAFRSGWNRLGGSDDVQFVNVPANTGVNPLRIGTITVNAVPEPRAWMLVSLALLMFFSRLSCRTIGEAPSFAARWSPLMQQSEFNEQRSV